MVGLFTRHERSALAIFGLMVGLSIFDAERFDALNEIYAMLLFVIPVGLLIATDGERHQMSRREDDR